MSLILLGILNSQAAGAGGGAAYDLLETVEPTSTTSVTFTGLGSYTDYKHLQIRSVQRSAYPIDQLANLAIRFNSDTGSNYAWHSLEGDGSTVSSNAFSSTTTIQIRESIPRDSATADSFGADVIDILDFSNTNKNTTIRALGGGNTATTSAIVLASALWVDTSAVTSIELYSTLGDFVTGSRFSLYGIKGA